VEELGGSQLLGRRAQQAEFRLLRLVGLLALLADLAHEALGHDRPVDDATRNGFTPMSIMRVTALGASFVCSVLNTKWPVSDAFPAISAVSKSRISPIMMMFAPGAGWRAARRKRSCDVRAHLHLLMPLIWYSTGLPR
jgi:hypothetical protein